MRQVKTKMDDENKLTTSEAANILPWSQISKLKPNDIYDTALIGVYVDIPPRRLDYGLMKISNTDKNLDDNFNYLVLKPMKFVFLNYKTASKFGRQEFDILSGLASKLKLYITDSGLTNGDFLFGTTPTKPYKLFSSQVSKVFKAHTGK